MIDVHSHILPEIDDGSSSMEVTNAMLAAASAIGIHTIVATPHLEGPLSESYAGMVHAAYTRVREMASSAGIQLVSGFEVRLTPDVPQRLRDGEPITLGGKRAILVDLPFIERPHYVAETLFSIQTSGFQPILAHPERYPDIQDDPTSGLELADRGIVLQVTVGSFSGAFGKRAKRTAERLLQLGAVHLVATDAHSAGHRMAAVGPGLARLHELAGAGVVEHLTAAAPAMILDRGEAPPPPRPLEARSMRSRLTSLFG